MAGTSVEREMAKRNKEGEREKEVAADTIQERVERLSICSPPHFPSPSDTQPPVHHKESI